MLLFSTLLFSLFITMALIPLFKRKASLLNCIDNPNERKVHSRPMPKVGGLAMAIGALVPLMMFGTMDRFDLSLLVGCYIIAIFGFVDDSRNLSWRGKLAAQFVATIVVVFFGGVKLSFVGTFLPGGFLTDWMASILTVFLIIGVTNAVNLADGLDGLAGGIMLVSFTCIGFLAYRSGNNMVLLLSVSTAGAILGFLPYNTHPATVFMGDTGSQLLGFLAATLSIIVTQSNHAISPVVPFFLVGLPIIDTLRVILKRISNGQLPFYADKNHLHHRLIRMNFYHSEAVLILFILQCGLVLTGYSLRFHSEWILSTIFIGWTLGVVSIFSFAQRSNLRLQRPGAFDRLIKHKLKTNIKDGNLTVKISQKLVEYGLPFLIIVTCALPGRMPRFMSIFAAGLIGILGLTHIIWPAHQKNALRLAIYFFMPFVIYYSETRIASWVSTEWQLAYNILFIFLIFFAVMTLRTTRRRHNFRLKPLDYIILFVAIIVPNLPFVGLYNFQVGAIVAKIMVLFFVFEVMVGELKDRKHRFNWEAVAALLVVMAKAMV